MIGANSHTKRYVYPIWLRVFALGAATVALLLLAGPPSLFVNADPKLPWNEQSRILPRNQTPKFELSEEQPKLTNVFRYKTDIELEGQEQGKINFVLYPDGIIKGIWNGEYDRDEDTHCLIMSASFTGNIDPKRKFVENGVEDPTKLYFITIGSYNIVTNVKSTGKSSQECGLLYVRGWITTSYTITGEVIITKDKKSYESISWTADPIN